MKFDIREKAMEQLNPLFNLFTTNQVQMIMMSWLPSLMDNKVLSGIPMVDMFIFSILSTLVVSFMDIIKVLGQAAWDYEEDHEEVTSFRVDPTRRDQCKQLVTNPYYAALSWLITQGARDLDDGQFIIQVAEGHEEEGKLLDFDILPEENHEFTITYQHERYRVSTKGRSANGNNSFKRLNQDEEGEPETEESKQSSIYVTPLGPVTEEAKTSEKKGFFSPTKTLSPVSRDVKWFESLLRKICNEHKKNLSREKSRKRWQLGHACQWNTSINLQKNNGISSIALDKKQEVMLIKDITTFLKDQKFYEHLGLPYRRGYLFHGRPGTGKTSLINAIAGELGRNLYFVNLRDVVNDTQLQNAFSMVPQGQIIVMEDIDAMTKVVHRRLSPNGDHAPPEDQELVMTTPSPHMLGKPQGLVQRKTMTLSALLGCLDGYIMQPGNIVIMTTNHPEVLDPALIRPGRIDLTLELGCATRYQIRRMYDNIVLTEQNEPESEIKPIDEEWLANFPEDLIPPCEVARQMLLHRRNPEDIWPAVDELVEQFQAGALSIEEQEEMLRQEEEKKRQAAANN